MQLQKNKSDKSDAQMLSQYGKSQTIEQWLPVASHYEDCQQLMGLIQLLFKQKTAMKNKAHSLGSKGEFKGKIKNVINRQLRELDRDITVLERQLEEIIREHENDLYTRMQSIPGMGRKTALVLIATTQGFTTFKSAAQVIAYLGLAPTHRNSGSSVRGKSRISKTGDPKVRNHLFMCSFTACQTNPQCRALYQRLINKGKSKKLALIAVANKLIRQAFALAQNGLVYDPNYQSVKA